jgi:death-on-curing protein
MRYFSLEEVIYIYSEVVQRSGAQAGIRDDGLLDDILAKPLVAFEGEELYPDIYTKAAVLMFAMVNLKPFVSANKPTAVMCALFLLRANGYNIISTQDSLVELTEGTETGKYKVDHLVNWFRRNAVPM